MKLKLLFLLFFTTLSSFAQETSIPDINFEKKLIALGIDSGIRDGKVLTGRISSLTSLDVSSASITDLTGIQDFKNLTSLICNNNNLTTLDVSKNTNLKTLYCYSNIQLTTLDVSKNTALTTLYCYFNRLTTLDVSNNTALKYLYCYNSTLTTLDVSKNTALTIFNCSYNLLTTLDVSKNTALINLDCSYNKLTTLDVSKNTTLINFDCGLNNLISLNIKNGNNNKLDVNNIEFRGNPNLSCIQVDNAAYSNENWYNAKATTASYSVNCPSLGIAESVFDKAVIYPNPTKGELHIDNAIVEKATIYNVLGKLVKTEIFTNSSNNNTIDLTGSPTGVYYIYLESQGNTIVKKIVIE